MLLGETALNINRTLAVPPKYTPELGQGSEGLPPRPGRASVTLQVKR